MAVLPGGLYLTLIYARSDRRSRQSLAGLLGFLQHDLGAAFAFVARLFPDFIRWALLRAHVRNRDLPGSGEDPGIVDRRLVVHVVGIHEGVALDDACGVAE